MISILANPLRFKKFARYASPIFGIAALILIAAGLWYALYNSPEDKLHENAVRILYIHVPAALISMAAYGAMAVASLIAFIWRHPLADVLARSMALPGAAFTVLTLATGAIWGKTAWGTFWQWDGRMTSTLILLFLYIGYLQVWSIIEDKRRAARIAGLIAMVGSINLPVIKFSVDWWNSLHQGATLGGPGFETSMGTPLYLLMLGYGCFFAWLTINRVLDSIERAKQKRTKTPRGASAVMEDI